MQGEVNKIHQLLKRSEKVPESVLKLLEDTVIGTNGLRYQLKDTADKIHLLNRPHFLYLERNGKCVGNITICKRQITIGQENIESNYLRYFAFNKLFQGSAVKRKGNSRFHQYFQALFESSNFNPVEAETKKSLYWAYIDPENLRSFNMNEKLGFETIGQFTTTAFSRIRPKKSSSVRLAKSEEHPVILEMIKAFYHDFDFFSNVHLFENDNFYVYETNGEIIAGIQANPIRWEILQLPGLSGKIMLKTAPYIPGLKKLINPKDHRFLATEGLFWKNGHQKVVEELLESVLDMSKHHSLLIWTDTANDMVQKLPVQWGLMNRLKSDNKINIVAKFIDFEENEKITIKTKKKYLSGFDMT